MDKKYVKQKIKELRQYAAKSGMDIRFNQYPNKFNTFCIFIYDREFRPNTYAVGFDGTFDSEGDFEKCLKQAYDEIDDPYWYNQEYKM